MQQLEAESLTVAKQSEVIKRVSSWLEQSEMTVAWAWQGLAWLHALPNFAGVLEESAWFAVIDRLRQAAREFAEQDARGNPLLFQLVAVETPLSLAYLFPELEPCAELDVPAMRSLRRLGEECFDSGLPVGTHLGSLRSLLASWTRTALMAKALDPVDFEDATSSQFAAVVRNAIRLAPATDSDASFTTWLPRTLALAGDEMSNELARGILGIKSKTPAKKLAEIEAAGYSEKSKVAVMRSLVRANSPLVTVSFDSSEIRLELSSWTKLFSGNWRTQLTIDGRVLPQPQEWDEVLWHADADAVYIELEATINSQWRIQRHVLLAREENFALLGDAILGTAEANISYRMSLPLAAGISFEPAVETHEGSLVERSKRCTVLPLALPEWRSDRPMGQLKLEGHELAYSVERRGRSIYAPLFIPLAPIRGKFDYTWRWLTIGEKLEIQSPDVAVAYRAQLHKRHFAIYRSLFEKGNRTFLGKNITNEFYVGRIDQEGKYEPIMEVE